MVDVVDVLGLDVLGPSHLVVVRGGGDLATGVVWRLHHGGFGVVVTELAAPLTVRRTVAVSTAVTCGQTAVEGMVARLVDAEEARRVAARGEIAVVVSPTLPALGQDVVVDARLAKRNIDTRVSDARLVVGLGPGFCAGVDCHAVIETMRGPRLGRVIWQGSAAPNTGTPGEVGGHGADRVLRAETGGIARWDREIGDAVEAGERLGIVGDQVLPAPFRGVVRGLIAEGTPVAPGCKVGDIDPRADTRCDEISDKALAVGGGVLEAVLRWMRTTPTTR